MRVETGGVCAEIFYALVAEDMGDMQAGRVFVVSFRVDEARYGALHFKELHTITEFRWRLYGPDSTKPIVTSAVQQSYSLPFYVWAPR